MILINTGFIDLVIGVAVAISLILLMGVFIQINHTYLGPLKLKRRLRLGPLNKLEPLGQGFQLINQEYYSGIFNHYLINIGYNWNSLSTFAKPCIWIEVFFNEGQATAGSERRRGSSHPGSKSLQSTKLHWKNESVYIEEEYLFFPPGLKTLITRIEAIIGILRNSGMEPKADIIKPEKYTDQNWITPISYLRNYFSRKR